MIYISLIHCRPPTRGISNTQMVAASRRGCLGMFPNRNTRLLEWTSDYQQPTPPNSECLYISLHKRHFSKKNCLLQSYQGMGDPKTENNSPSHLQHFFSPFLAQHCGPHQYRHYAWPNHPQHHYFWQRPQISSRPLVMPFNYRHQVSVMLRAMYEITS